MRRLGDILRYLNRILYKRLKWLGVLMLVMSFFGAALEMLGVSAILPLVSTLTEPDKLMANKYIIYIVKLLGITEYRGIVLTVGVGVISIYLIKNVFFLFLTWTRAKYSAKIQRELSTRMMSSYMKRGYSYFLGVNVGELQRGITVDTINVYNIIYHGLRIAVEILTIVLISIYMLITDVYMAIITILLASMCILLIYSVFRRSMNISGNKYRNYTSIINQILLHAFQGIKDVIVLDKREYFADEYNKNCDMQQRAKISQIMGTESPAYIIEAICASGLLGVVIWRLIDGGTGSGVIGTLAVFVVGAFRILPSLGRISASVNTITFSVSGLKAVYDNVVEADIENALYEEERAKRNGDDNEYDFQGISINGVSYTYPGSEVSVIDNIDMNINVGQCVAFIGASGAGKTTLADIILGLLRPSSGSITSGTVDIANIPAKWSSMIGYVPQSVYLADNTIRFNVAFAEAFDTVNDEDVWQALEMAQLRDYVEHLPEGINTYVGDRGIRLSGGQRQRIAIARAMYHRPKLLVLDEATAALDNETERAVMEAVEALQGRVTMIIVAHRLTTIRNCDIIYEIKDGKIEIKAGEKVLEG